MGELILSAFADEYDKDVDVQIKMLLENDLKYIEPRFIGEKSIADLSASEARELKVKLGNLKVSSIGSPLGKINLEEDFEVHLEKAKRVFETANILDTGNVRLFSFYLPKGKSRKECRGEVIEKLGRLIDTAKSFSVTPCHENEAAIYGEAPKDCFDLLQTFNGDLKCVFDMGNFVLDGHDPFAAYELLKNHIQYFHIKDALYEGAVVPPGCGAGCIQEIITDYSKACKGDVILTLEPHLQTFDGLNMLVGKAFDNPYKYSTKEDAFLDALDRVRKILH